MARQIIYDNELILKKSLEFVSNNGLEKMNARDLAKYIGCSTQPIYRGFKNKEDLCNNLLNRIQKQYEEFTYKFIDDNDYLFTTNYSYALFALKEPKLFEALFLDGDCNVISLEDFLNQKENRKAIEFISKKQNITSKQTRRLFRDVKFYTYGLACQIVYGKLKLSEENIKLLIKNNIKQTYLYV